MHLYSLFIILVSVLLFFLLGHFISLPFRLNSKDKPIYSVFSNTIIGLLTTITLFAVIKTNFNTIFLGVIILMISYVIYFFYFLPNNKFNFNVKKLLPKYNELKVLLVLIFICLIYFFIQSSLFYNYPLNNFPPMDFLFYASVIQCLGQYGIETINNVIYPFTYTDIATPYHYIDLWFATLYFYVFGVKSLEAYVVITTTILSSLLFIGMISIVSKLTKSKYLIFIAGFAIYVTYFDFTNWLGGFASMTWAVMSNPKFMFIGLVFIWYFIEVLNNNNSKSYLFILLLLPVFNIIYAPALYLTLGSITLFYYLMHRTRRNIFLLLVVLISAFFIFIFYKYNSSETTIQLNLLNLLKRSLHFSFIYRIWDVVKDVVISYAILWAPLLLLTFFNYKKSIQIIKETKTIFSITLLLVFWGLVIWNILYDLYDSFQFFFLTLIGFSLLSIVSVFLVFSKLDTLFLKRLMIVFIFTVCVFFTYNMFQIPGFYIYTDNPNSIEYVDQVQKKIKEKQNFNYIGVNIKSTQERINSRNSYGKITNYFITNYDGFYTVCLNPNSEFGNNTQDNTYNHVTDPAAFQEYLKNKGSMNKSTEQIYVDYIKENKIEYLVLDKNVELPGVFCSMVDTILIDKKSGESFVFLKYM